MLSPDEEYRLDEQRFVESTVSHLHHQTEEGYISIFGHLAQGMIGILAGNRPINQESPGEGNLPLDDKKTAEIKALWKHIMATTILFCSAGPDGFDKVQFDWVLSRIYEKLAGSIMSQVVSKRMQEAPHRM